MSKKYNHIGRTSLWRMLTLLILLSLLVVSAIPNIYHDSAQLSWNESVPQNQIEQLQSALQSADIDIGDIDYQENSISVIVQNASQGTEALDVINQLYANPSDLKIERITNTPSWMQNLGLGPIKLGLDLSGGVLFVLEVDIDQAKQDYLSNIASSAQQLIVENRIRGIYAKVQGSNSISIKFTRVNKSILGASQVKLESVIEELQSQYNGLLVAKTDSETVIKLSEEAQRVFAKNMMHEALTTMRGRIEELGITEAIVQRQGKNRIRIELPGVQNPEKAKRIIGATASLAFYQLQTNALTHAKHIDMDNGRQLNLNKLPVFTGANIKDANAGRDEMGMPLVNLVLDSRGGDKMSDFSKVNVGNPLVTVFSEYYRDAHDKLVKTEKVISYATIQQHLGSRFSLTNLESSQHAQELAMLIRAGSLTAPVTIVKQRTIEAKLGQENIKNGLTALAVGLSLTLSFMFIYYRQLGVVANIALISNLVSLLGLISLLPGAVLTLPGIAGFVLTVGMAVDTNVLIFERIKEEIKRGKSRLSAIYSGYDKAWSAIFDANITTLITGVILYAIGYGPVKGFALILCLGILTSMFTGVFMSKIITPLLFKSPINTKEAS